MDDNGEHIDRLVTDLVVIGKDLRKQTDAQIDLLQDRLIGEANNLQLITGMTLVKSELLLVRYAAVLGQRASYHILRAYWHASPSLMAILAAIWAVVQVIWQIVKIILQIVEWVQALHLDDLLAKYWPAFEQARTKFRQWVSSLSEALGWGVDGLLHLLHAAQGFGDVFAGLSGKERSWLDAEWMVKTGNVLEQINSFADQIAERPGEILEIIFQSEAFKNFTLTSDFGVKLTRTLTEALDRAKNAAVAVNSVANELAAIQNNMPALVAEYIPAQIWTSLSTVSSTIESKILPTITKIQTKVDLLDSIFETHAEKLSELADSLAHPGSLLEGVDALPDYVKNSELALIDDVTSRAFESLTDAERAAMAAELEEFDRIDTLQNAPVAALPYLTLEYETKGGLHGITMTPQETWFIDGYKDQH